MQSYLWQLCIFISYCTQSWVALFIRIACSILPVRGQWQIRHIFFHFFPFWTQNYAWPLLCQSGSSLRWNIDNRYAHGSVRQFRWQWGTVPFQTVLACGYGWVPVPLPVNGKWNLHYSFRSGCCPPAWTNIDNPECWANALSAHTVEYNWFW